MWDASAGDLLLRQNTTSVISLDGSTGDATFGEIGASKFNLMWDSSAGDLLIRENTTNIFQFQGSTGDMFIGQVATDHANMFWDKSAGRLNFRGGTGGTSVQAYVDTDGSIVAGGGNVKLDENGLGFVGGTHGWNDITWYAEAFSTRIFHINSFKSALGDVTTALLAQNSDEGRFSRIILESISDASKRGRLVVYAKDDEDDIYLDFAIGGLSPSSVFRVKNDGVRIADGLYVGGTGTAPDEDWIHVDGGIKTGDGTNIAPTFSFRGDTDTGMYTGASDQVDFTCGGNRCFIIAQHVKYIRSTNYNTYSTLTYDNTTNSKQWILDSRQSDDSGDDQDSFLFAHYNGSSWLEPLRLRADAWNTMPGALRIGAAGRPGHKFEVMVNAAGWQGLYWNQRENNDANCLAMRTGPNETTHTAGFILFQRAGGTGLGQIKGNNNNGVVYESLSDVRMKRVCGVLDNIEVLKAVKPILYNGKDSRANAVPIAGFSAQDFHKVCQGVASYDEETDRYFMDYSQTTPYLWAGWRNHEARIVELEQRVEELERRQDR